MLKDMIILFLQQNAGVTKSKTYDHGVDKETRGKTTPRDRRKTASPCKPKSKRLRVLEVHCKYAFAVETTLDFSIVLVSAGLDHCGLPPRTKGGVRR